MHLTLILVPSPPDLKRIIHSYPNRSVYKVPYNKSTTAISYNWYWKRINELQWYKKNFGYTQALSRLSKFVMFTSPFHLLKMHWKFISIPDSFIHPTKVETTPKILTKTSIYRYTKRHYEWFNRAVKCLGRQLKMSWKCLSHQW